MQTSLRRIPGCGMSNLRDLGGYPAAYGAATRYHVLYRADIPRDFGPEQADNLRATGITTAVDLRDPAREGRNPLIDCPWITLITIPLLKFQQFDLVPRHDTLDILYVQALEHAKAEIAKVMRALNAAPGPALFHCSAGKDRTGAIAALLLALCGVDELDILADYQQSELYLAPVYEQLRRMMERMPVTETPPEALREEMLRSHPDLMRPMLAQINARGGAAAYLACCGLAEAEIAALRGKLIDS